MPVLDPRGNGYKPRNWRHAYDAFLQFKRAVDTVSGRLRLGISTNGWQLAVPGRIKGMADPRWQLTFTNIDGQMETVYVGSDGMTARNTIRDLHRTYIELLLARKPLHSTSSQSHSSSDPRFDHATVARMIAKWNEMSKAKSVKEWNANLAANPDVVKFMKSRAGIFNMTMKDYLFREPMSAKWPTPPRSQKEWQGRKAQTEDYLRTTERDRNTSGGEKTVDPGPGWMG